MIVYFASSSHVLYVYIGRIQMTITLSTSGIRYTFASLPTITPWIGAENEFVLRTSHEQSLFYIEMCF